jgi:hypothetical protein
MCVGVWYINEVNQESITAFNRGYKGSNFLASSKSISESITMLCYQIGSNITCYNMTQVNIKHDYITDVK